MNIKVSTVDTEHRYAVAAELFGLLSAPVRLKIVCALVDGERNVGQLLALVAASQPNLSQHLSMMYRSGVLAKRREGSLVHYRIADDRARSLCLTVMDPTAPVGQQPNAI